mgnify:CR=1 FL=1
MTRIIIPIQKSSIISGYMLPFMTCLRELSLFMLLCTQGFILSTTLDYFDEMGLYAFSSGINLILIITILVFNTRGQQGHRSQSGRGNRRLNHA